MGPAGGEDEVLYFYDKRDHGFVQAEFIGRLINRQKVYPARLRQTLSQR